ncbi:chromosome segregation protein SMC [Bacillaceae bacterium S4-13-56]
MFLKRLETVGFKSFAERTTVEFVPGVTAVVGPNGSGKSNIIDAVRWVLGEQSAKSLRGSKMEDIIFAGSDSRKPLNFAEVSLILDNADQTLPIDYHEVAVTRRVYRSGESEFLINQQSCRLKDIVDLFMDSGLGREAFSIISQGKIEEILSSKAEERRTIFEEAAGVLKYKNRKKKAEYKLAETQENLNRVEDIIYELEQQLEPLKEQAAIAKEYLDKKEVLKEKEVSLLVTEIEAFHLEWQAILSELKEKQDEAIKLQTEIQSGEAEMEAEQSQIQTLEESIEKLQESLLELTRDLEHIEGKKELYHQRLRYSEEKILKIDQDLLAYQNQKENLDVKIQLQREAAKVKEKSLFEVKKQVEEKEKEFSHLSINTEEVLENLKSDYIERLNEQAALRNETQSLNKQREQVERRIQRLREKFQDSISERKMIEAQISDRNYKVLESEEELSQLLSSLQQLNQEKNRAEKALEQDQSKLYQGYQFAEKLRSKKEMLEDLKEDFSGFFQGVREVLKARENKELNNIFGAIIELISIPDDYVTAIETTLNAQAQHIVVQNENTARECILYLKKNQKGRATFLPLESIQERSIPSSLLQGIKNDLGFVGVASDLVSSDPTVSKAVRHLLGHIVIAKTLKDANRLATQLYRKYRIVTLDGDVVNPGGSMSGGAKANTKSSLFTRDKELQDVTKKLEEYQVKIKAFEQHVKQQKEKLKEIEHQRVELEQKRSSIEGKLQTRRDDYKEISYQEKRMNEQLALFDQEESQLTQEEKEYRSQLTKCKEQMDLLQEKIQLMKEEMDQLSRQQSEQRTSKESVSEVLQSLRIKLAENQTELRSEVDKHQRLKKELEVVKESILELTNERHQIEEEIKGEESEDVLVEKLKMVKQEKFQTEQLIQQRRENRLKRIQKVQDETRELKQIKKIFEALQNEIRQKEVKSNRLDVELENRLHTLREDYTLSFEKAKSNYPIVDDVEEARKKVKFIKREIEELGAVNIGAIEEYERIKERYEFLSEQQSDLEQAKLTLREIIAEMDQEMSRRFEDTFSQIRIEFQKVFKALFGGGQADLRLTDPSAILETGVDIVAQPPGKKLQNLGLLSGGERAFTAIALLFAILTVRPVPFCILDEVEAALDDANVNRFARYLKRFSQNTQFIVITHRKGTMEEADVLYGVTMQESGVSRLVSVKLEETKEFVEVGKEDRN